MKELPHAPGFTLAANAFMGPTQLVGFSVAHQPATVFSHFHDFFELAFVLQGRGHHVTDDGSQAIRRGHAIFVAPGVGHGYEHGAGLVVLNCFLRVEAARFDLSWAQRDGRLGRLFAPGGMPPTLPTVVELDEHELAVCLAHLDAIRDRPVEERGEAFELGHLLLVLDAMARRLDDQQPSGRPAATSAMPALVTEAAALVEHDLRRHWTLDELAQALAVDPFHLVRLFKRWLGAPPIAWGNHLRGQRAASLLAASDDPIAAVGAEVGWPDPAHFSRRFRHEHGMSPRMYRSQLRQRRDPRSRDAAAVDPDAWAPASAPPASPAGPTGG